MFKLSMSTHNSAFAESRDFEIARILREVADKVENGHYQSCKRKADQGAMVDVNGNFVGNFTITNR